MNEDEKTPICSRCGNKCREQTHGIPTWFGKYHNADLKEAICIDCWEKRRKMGKDGEYGVTVARKPVEL